MFVHELFAIVVGKGEPVVRVAALFRHWVEAPCRLVFRRKLRSEARGSLGFGNTLCVLRQLGERDIGIDDVEAGILQRGLKPANAPHVVAKSHKREIGLMAKNRNGDDLIALGLCLLNRSGDGVSIGQWGHLAEEVNDGHADVGGNNVSHGLESTACLLTPVRASVCGGRRRVSRRNRDHSVVIGHPRGGFSMLRARRNQHIPLGPKHL